MRNDDTPSKDREEYSSLRAARGSLVGQILESSFVASHRCAVRFLVWTFTRSVQQRPSPGNELVIDGHSMIDTLLLARLIVETSLLSNCLYLPRVEHE